MRPRFCVGSLQKVRDAIPAPSVSDSSCTVGCTMGCATDSVHRSSAQQRKHESGAYATPPDFVYVFVKLECALGSDSCGLAAESMISTSI